MEMGFDVRGVVFYMWVFFLFFVVFVTDVFGRFLVES